MANSEALGLAILLVVLFGGLFAYRGVLRFAYPLREQMMEQGLELLRSGQLNKRESNIVRFCLDNAMSFSSGWMPLQAAWLALMDGRDRAGKPAARAGELVIRPDRIHGVVARFLASALIANPIALALFVPLMITLMIVRREQPKPAIRETAATLPMTHGFCAP